MRLLPTGRGDSVPCGPRVAQSIVSGHQIALVLGTLGLGVVVITLASSANGLYLYVVVFGIAFGARSPLRASVIAAHFGRRAYGTITSVQGVIMAVPAAFDPLAAGWLYDRLGNYQLAFWLTAASFAVAALLVIMTPSPPSESTATWVN